MPCGLLSIIDTRDRRRTSGGCGDISTLLLRGSIVELYKQEILRCDEAAGRREKWSEGVGESGSAHLFFVRLVQLRLRCFQVFHRLTDKVFSLVDGLNVSLIDYSLFGQNVHDLIDQ